jgi:hypothetical protein
MTSEKQIEALDRFTEAVIDYVDRKLVKKILSDMSFLGNSAPSRKSANDHRSTIEAI